MGIKPRYYILHLSFVISAGKCHEKYVLEMTKMLLSSQKLYILLDFRCRLGYRGNVAKAYDLTDYDADVPH